ncbi:MAG: ketoacyl-ACP synthase III [Aequorivita sp.]
MVYLNAISYYLPEQSIDNKEIIKDFFDFGGKSDIDITPESIFQQCGINTRFSAYPEDTAKDLGNRAAVKLFEEWNIDKSTIDYLIFVSDALEYKSPSTSSVMQNDLGLEQSIAALDVLQGCTGWVYGLSLGKALIHSGIAKKVLVVTADLPTRVIHPEDLELRSIFSDGGAASLISGEMMDSGINHSIGDFVFGTDGRGSKNLWVERSGTRDPVDEAWLKQHRNVPSKLMGGRLRMDSPKIFLFAVRRVPQLIKAILQKHEMEIDEIDLFIFHQANGTMLEFLRKRMKIPKEKFVISLEHIGNTVSATIPIALRGEVDKREIKKGQKILVAGFGIGYSWGATILTS